MTKWTRAVAMIGAVLVGTLFLPVSNSSEQVLPVGGSCFAAGRDTQEAGVFQKELSGTLDAGSLSCSGAPRSC